jgi:hypothetical protein
MNDSLVPWKTLSATVNVGTLTEGWSLAEHAADPSEAVRTFRVEVPFAAGFGGAPLVHVGLTGFDIDKWHTARLSLRVVAIRADGFTAEIATWSDTRVYSIEFNWLALGA